MNKIGLILAFIIVLAIPVSGYFGDKPNNIVIEKEIGLLQTVKERGYIVCGVNSGLPGFAAEDEEGQLGPILKVLSINLPFKHLGI